MRKIEQKKINSKDQVSYISSNDAFEMFKPASDFTETQLMITALKYVSLMSSGPPFFKVSHDNKQAGNDQSFACHQFSSLECCSNVLDVVGWGSSLSSWSNEFHQDTV